MDTDTDAAEKLSYLTPQTIAMILVIPKKLKVPARNVRSTNVTLFLDKEPQLPTLALLDRLPSVARSPYSI